MLSLHLLIVILLSCASIHAAPENGERKSEETKDELCQKSCSECMGSVSLLIDIARETNGEAMGLKLEAKGMETENKELEREIINLKRRIANPSAPYVDPPPLVTSTAGIPEVNFVQTICLDCTSLMSCLNTLGHVKDYWTSLEETKTEYETDIKSMQAKNKKFTRIRDSLKKKLSKVLNNN